MSDKLAGSRNLYQRSLTVGVLISLLLHFLLVTTLPSPKERASKRDLQVVEVSLDNLFRESEKPQIVSEPANAESENEPLKTSLLGEKNRVTEKEQIRRGVDPNAGPALSKPSQQAPPTSNRPLQTEAEKTPKAPKEKPQAKSNSPKKISSLTLSNDVLSEQFGDLSSQVSNPPSPVRENLEIPKTDISNYQAFNRPAGSGARFIGSAGDADFLPNLPDGDITLLNTKASTYAVFVRRVATRVFSHLRRSGWEQLSRSDIQKMSDFSTVEAVLSPEGDLLEVSLRSPSGSRSFDSVLVQASKAGANDPNPPKGARAVDGKIHFIFKAKSWSQIGPSRGGKGMTEQRWLLLSTGLG